MENNNKRRVAIAVGASVGVVLLAVAVAALFTFAAGLFVVFELMRALAPIVQYG